jgi:hypothetical protein
VLREVGGHGGGVRIQGTAGEQLRSGQVKDG